MSKDKKPLVDIYIDNLRTFGLYTNKDTGVVSAKIAGTDIPFTIKGKVLVAPIHSVLKESDWENVIPFHPLSENPKRKKSEIQERLGLIAANRAYTIISQMSIALLTLALDKKAQKELSVEQREVLKLIPEVDEKMIKNISKFYSEFIDVKSENKPLNFFVRRSGVWSGQEYDRVCIISSQMIDSEYTSNKELFGCSMRVKDHDHLFKLLRFMLPGIDEPDLNYSYGTNGTIAPSYQVLMMAWSRIAEDLNKVVKLFQDHVMDGKELISPTSWKKYLSQLMDYRNDIVPLPGNIGEAPTEELETEARRSKERDRRDRRKEEMKENRDRSISGRNKWRDNRRRSNDEGRERRAWGESRRRNDRDDYDDDRRGRRRGRRDDDYDDDYEDRGSRRRRRWGERDDDRGRSRGRRSGNDFDTYDLFCDTGTSDRDERREGRRRRYR